MPSVTTATVLRLMVSRRASSGFSAIARQTRATPGVYARDSSSRVRSATFGVTSILPPRCSRNVRSLTLRTSTPSSVLQRLATTWAAWAASAVSQVRSTTSVTGSESTTSSAVTMPPASPTAVVSRPIADGVGGHARPGSVIENPALGRRAWQSLMVAHLARSG